MLNMTDRDINFFKAFLRTAQLYWVDQQEEKIYQVDKVVGGNQVYTAATEGPEPCECVTFKGTSMYICLDNASLDEFYTMEPIK